MSTDLARCLEVAEDAARAAGDRLVELFHRGVQARFKGRFDLVTEADHDAQRIVVATLRAAFPEHGVLAEEGLDDPGRLPWRWVVDPLDGTTNFVHGHPHFAVSIGLQVEGRTVLGLVLDPNRGELFHALEGDGAHLNGQRIGVSDVDRLDHALAITGFPAHRERWDEALVVFERVLRRTRAVRRDGSAALDLCYVAAGRCEAFFEVGLGAWDTCAGALLVAEASGRVTDDVGRDHVPGAPWVVASNGLLQDELLACLAEGVAAASASGSSRPRTDGDAPTGSRG